MAGQLPPIEPVFAYQSRQLDTSDSYSCDVPQYIQQAQLMEPTMIDGTPAETVEPTDLSAAFATGVNPYNRAVN